MRQLVEALITAAIATAVEAGELDLRYTPECAVERPRDPAHGDWASTIALKLARELAAKPRDIAEVIAAHIGTSELIAAVEVAGPGFINIRLSAIALHQVIRSAHEQGANFARSNVGEGQRLNIEFVSANPTGPMHVGHGRWAALGNAMCNVCAHAGWQVTREFYVNDAGHQMDVFGQSVALRYRELAGEQIEIPSEFYGGSYVTDIAHQIVDEGGHDPADVEFFRERGYQLMLEHMREVCERAGVHFDVWFSERWLYGNSVASPVTQEGVPVASSLVACEDTAAAPDSGLSGLAGGNAVERMLAKLEARGYLYESEGATWFRSTDLGDDKDRVLVKSDGSYTYFAPDIAYHLDKLERPAGTWSAGSPAGSEYLVNIWGADHHGYISRMQAAVTALGHDGKLTVVLGQLVNLYRGGEAVRMSKRTGEMVTFEELIEEVGSDATKYLMLSRSSDQPIDFDIEVAKKQDASNPVYYVQYAHARICSLLRKAGSPGAAQTQQQPLGSEQATRPAIDAAQAQQSSLGAIAKDNALAPGLSTAVPDLSLLVEETELALARELARLSEVVEVAARDLAPFRLTHYAHDLATAFHAFYTRCPVLTAKPALAAARLYLAEATQSVLALTLFLLGVSAPERM